MAVGGSWAGIGSQDCSYFEADSTMCGMYRQGCGIQTEKDGTRIGRGGLRGSGIGRELCIGLGWIRIRR